MDIKFQGFELGIVGDGIVWPAFESYLLCKAGEEIMYHPFNRILCLDNDLHSDYLLGLFVSVKEQKRFTQIKNMGGDFHLSAKDLEEGSRLADFNFFIVNKRTKRGIYQYYHQSCSLLQFLGFLEAQFLKLRKLTDRNILNGQYKNEKDRDRQRAALNRTHLSVEPLVKKESFDQLLEQFAQIKELKFDLATYIADEAFFRPWKDAASKETGRVLFQQGMLETVKTAIRRVMHSDQFDNLRVKGISSSTGCLVTLKMINNLQDFGQHDYDDLTEHLAVNLATFTTSRLLDLLIKAATEHDYIFGQSMEQPAPVLC